jgi:hypothetical protein
MSICTMQHYKDSYQSADNANVIGKSTTHYNKWT